MINEKELRDLLVKYISKFDFTYLMKACGHKDICMKCKNYKWISHTECSHNWGWGCIKKHNLSFGTCRGKDFDPRDNFLKEMKRK